MFCNVCHVRCLARRLLERLEAIEHPSGLVRNACPRRVSVKTKGRPVKRVVERRDGDVVLPAVGTVDARGALLSQTSVQVVNDANLVRSAGSLRGKKASRSFAVEFGLRRQDQLGGLPRVRHVDLPPVVAPEKPLPLLWPCCACDRAIEGTRSQQRKR